mmetsp:Transcript_15643/g.44532  ORF Transcript_15643/g.44532 Transcript_15643/m.44532 type:complete len:382 (-) Transcript_15643:676-1821(-)
MSMQEEPKPQLANQRSSGLKATEQTQSVLFGSWKITLSRITSHTETCMSSPPAAKKRDCDDQARVRMPATHRSSEVFTKSLSTSNKVTLLSSPPTASNLPDGEKRVTWTMFLKAVDPAYVHSPPAASKRQMTVFIIALSNLFVIKPCVKSVPPPPARNSPVGENATLWTWPSCRSSATWSNWGTVKSKTLWAEVPTANISFGVDVMARLSNPSSSWALPISSALSRSQTVSPPSESATATKRPLGENATATGGTPSLDSKLFARRSMSQTTTVRSSPAATRAPPGPNSRDMTSSSCARDACARFSLGCMCMSLSRMPRTFATEAESDMTEARAATRANKVESAGALKVPVLRKPWPRPPSFTTCFGLAGAPAPRSQAAGSG